MKAMRGQAALLALLACTACVAVSAVDLGSAAAPLLIWSNTDSLASGSGSRVDYEVCTLANDLRQQCWAPKAIQIGPQALALFHQDVRGLRS